MLAMARSLLVYRLTGSAALLGIASVINFMPLIFLSPLGGVAGSSCAGGAITVASNVGFVDALEVSPDGAWALVARRQMHLPAELYRVAVSGPGARTGVSQTR